MKTNKIIIKKRININKNIIKKIKNSKIIKIFQ